MKITVVIPTLNEQDGIGPTLDAINTAAFKKRGWTWEFLVVDGDSADQTRAEAEKRGARVVVDRRKGYGRAYKTGFQDATGDILLTGDADGTYPFDKAHLYIDQLLQGDLDFITCNRYGTLHAGAMSPKHHLGNFVLSATLRVLFWLRIKDSQSGMWVIRRSALDRIPYQDLSDGMAFSQEIKIEAFRRRDVAAQEIESELHARIGDAVIESWRDGFGNLGALWKKRFRSGQ